MKIPIPEITKAGILLEKTTLDFENESVSNPGCYQDQALIHMFYRAVSKGNHSSIGYCALSDPLTVKERWRQPIYTGQHPSESHGVEDPRITKIEDTYYMTYTAYDGKNALGALALSKDLQNFTRAGIITPQVTRQRFKELVRKNPRIPERYSNNESLYDENRPGTALLLWDKDVMFFPRKIKGKLAFLHRVFPGIQVVYCDSIADLTEEYWEDYLGNLDKYMVLGSKYAFEHQYIGGGCVPVETPAGWLVVYHGVEQGQQGKVYHAAAVLLDLDDPTVEIARLPIPLFSPEKEWETSGYVNNVVFPTGTARAGDRFYIYYGAGDSRIAVASLSFDELMNALLQQQLIYTS